MRRSFLCINRHMNGAIENDPKTWHGRYIRYMNSPCLQKTNSSRVGNYYHVHALSCPIIITQVTGIIPSIIGRSDRLPNNEAQTKRCRYNPISGTPTIPSVLRHMNRFIIISPQLQPVRGCPYHTSHEHDRDLQQATKIANENDPIRSYWERTTF